MQFELPSPLMTFDVALDDGAKIRVRRHGRAGGVRLLLAHGNGFAADAYFPYWQHLLPQFDLLVFDFRNHGQNVPVVPAHHTYEQLAARSRTRRERGQIRGSAKNRRPGFFIRCRAAPR